MAKINETLRQLRQDCGMTQEEVAEQVGLTRQAVSSYESGRTQPGVDILQRLAEIYQTDLTDIIYGRNQGIRLYSGLKITAIIMACVFLMAQLACSVLMWTANQFFSLFPGTVDEVEKATLVIRGRLMNAWTAVDGLYYGLFPLCCVALLVLTLCLRRPLAAKIKLLCGLSYAVASMVVILPWALSDPVFPPINYLTTPLLCLAQLALFLLLNLIIDFFRTRKIGRDGTSGEPDDREEEVFIPIYKRWWVWFLTVAVVAAIVLILVAVLPKTDAVEIPPVENPAFTLNGQNYPQDPILQDFLDRGWKRGKWNQKAGIYDEQGRVTNLVVTGYQLNFGEYHISAQLNVEDVRAGLEPGQCRLTSLSLYGKNVMNFSLDGKELSCVTRSEIEEILGQADEEQELSFGGATYRYAMPEKSIPDISFTFKNSTDPVGQILVVFYSIFDKE